MSTIRPVRDDRGRLVVGSHADVVAIARDPDTFSNATSRFLQIPNGLDGAEHAKFRRLLDPFLSPDALAWLVPHLERTAVAVLADCGHDRFDAVTDLGARFAVRAQSIWLGWSPDHEDDLLAWVAEHRAATRSGSLDRTAASAGWFDRFIRDVLAGHRANPSDSVTSQLLQVRRADGSPLRDEELVSILRNWTGGDLSSLALCIGVIAHFLATHPDEQERLRGAPTGEIDAAIDEMLRLDDPFPGNRRAATTDTDVAGCPVARGEHLVLNWRAANVDPDAFTDPQRYDPHAHRDRNLVYGTGSHVCPGRYLSTLELRVVLRTLLDHGTVELAGTAEREDAPVAGFRSVPIRVTRR